MGGIAAAALVGLPVAILGFLVMRNPMRLSILAPGEEGYYQRAFFDASSRNWARALGMLISLFGSSIAAAALAATFKTRVLQDISKGLWALMGLTFLALWCFGVGVAIWRAFRGKSLGWSEWFQMRKRGMELGPIDVSPSITPQMRKETLVFTVVFSVLVSVAAGFALVH
jgi:hypothetical protein